MDAEGCIDLRLALSRKAQVQGMAASGHRMSHHGARFEHRAGGGIRTWAYRSQLAAVGSKSASRIGHGAPDFCARAPDGGWDAPWIGSL